MMAAILAAVTGLNAQAQLTQQAQPQGAQPQQSQTGQTRTGQASITVESSKPSGIIDEMLYGQLFEHIYFSANNGVWQELIQERSFEPEQYPGIHPRDGYFDGWYMDDDMVLHSPT
ncbi:MAG: hypothetical protein MJY75_08320, partial [Bacteroidaceae bacterium]|nr:hypothetical protein [Bacteroidaceae bacterium]